MKKARANWTLPTMNQEIPSSINMMVPLPSAEEMHLLKEISGQAAAGAMTPDPNDPNAQFEKKRTFRMVNHFGKKPPMMPISSTQNQGPKSRNKGQKSIGGVERASASYNIKVNKNNFDTIDEEMGSREVKERPFATLQNAAENIMNIERKLNKKSPFGTGALTPDNMRAQRKTQQFTSS